MPTIEVRLPALHPSQKVVRDSQARFKVLACGRRWGKTLLGVALCVECAVQGGHAWWIAPTFPVASIGWRAIKKLCRQIPGTDAREGERMVTFPEGGWIQVKSSDNPDSLRGEGLDLAVFDECAFQVEQAWQESVRPALSDKGGKALFISTPQGRNWFWRLWSRGQEGGEEWTSWQFPTADNPYIAKEEIEAAKRGTPERVFAQEYLADFSLSEGTFFPEWSESKHLVKELMEIPTEWTRWVAVDWGFADPCAVLWLARDPSTRRIYAYRELYQRGLREEQQAQRILSMTGTEKINLWLGDPSMWNQRSESGRPSIASIYHACKVPIMPAGNARVSGWQIVRQVLSGDVPRLQVLPTCANLIRTLPEMVHDPIVAEDLADKIRGVKTDDHAVDCLRYALTAEAQPTSSMRVQNFQFVPR